MVAAVALTAVPLASPVAADEDTAGSTTRDQVGLSVDGVHYRDALIRPLFGPDVRWVPGDVRTSRFFVRQGEDRAVALEVGGGRVNDLLDEGTLVVSARVGDGAWRDLSDRSLVRLAVPADEKVAVSVRVSLAGDAPPDASVEAADLDVAVRLDELPEASRAGAGERNTWWVVPLGLLLLSGGAVLYARREAVRPLPVLPR